MPTVPGIPSSMRAQLGEAESKKPTPEHLLMTAADMHNRGQLTQNPSSYGTPGADLRLPFPGGGRGTRPTGQKGKRR
jgi:hypothetical protein